MCIVCVSIQIRSGTYGIRTRKEGPISSVTRICCLGFAYMHVMRFGPEDVMERNQRIDSTYFIEQ
jgi:hypothetical protein